MISIDVHILYVKNRKRKSVLLNEQQRSEEWIVDLVSIIHTYVIIFHYLFIVTNKKEYLGRPLVVVVPDAMRIR